MKLVRTRATSKVTKQQNIHARNIYLNPEEKGQNNPAETFEDIYNKDGKLIISTWISLIDKIYKKPNKKEIINEKSNNYRKNKEKYIIIENSLIYKNREVLREACWPYIQDYFNNHNINDSDGKLKTLWASKIHSYDIHLYIEKCKFNNEKNLYMRGRLYDKFISTETNFILTPTDAKEIAEKINTHLNIKSIRDASGKLSDIAHKNLSIHKSVASVKMNETPDFSAVKDIYKNHQDIVKIIYEETSHIISENKRISLDIPMQNLRNHWKIVFPDCNMAQAKEQSPILFELHEMIKTYYQTTFKRNFTKKDKLQKILPKNLEKMLTLLSHKSENSDISTYIRMGKLIHYGLGTSDWSNVLFTDRTQWLEQCAWRNTDKQIEIKQSESLLRIFHECISQASFNLRRWLDPDNNVFQDILNSPKINYESPFLLERFDLLFPDFFDTEYAEITNKLANVPEDRKTTVRINLQKSIKKEVGKNIRQFTENFRHQLFHFKDSTAILGNNLLNDKNDNPFANSNRFTNIYLYNQQQLTGLTKEKLQGAQAEKYISQRDFTKLVDMAMEDTPMLPLPSFKHILKRAEDVKKIKHSLPKPYSRQEKQEKPAFLAQYICLKHIYEYKFKIYLHDIKADKLNKIIKDVLDATTQAAQQINRKEKEITAKAYKLVGEDSFENIESFFHRLFSLTAKEMAVQTHYDSHSENNAEQALHIENLKKDVVLIAFNQFMVANFKNILFINENTHAKEDYEIDNITINETPPKTPSDMLSYFYGFCHLVPVETLNRLYHQLSRNIIARKTSDNIVQNDNLNKIAQTLALYIRMHDYKQSHISIKEADIKEFYEDDIIEKLYPENTNEIDEETPLIPYRGLREFKRFGWPEPIKEHLHQYKITKADYEQWVSLHKEIIPNQKAREDIHAEWVKERKKWDFVKAKKNDYTRLVNIINEHNHLQNKIFLVDHIKIYHLVMQIFSRFVTYAHHFERDWYFIAIAYAFTNGDSLEDVYDNSLENASGTNTAEYIRKGQINKLSDTVIDNYLNIAKTKDIRNDFAHFNMLIGKKPFKDLTHWVNQARELMAYDRKMKNSIPKAIKRILEENNLADIRWEIDNHQLTSFKAKAKTIQHLRNKDITEDLHSEDYVNIVNKLFGA